MNSRERLLTALVGKQPDRVPTWELAINEPVIRGILKEEARAIGDLNAYMVLAERLDLDGLTAFEAMNYQKKKDGVIQDEWGITYKIGAQGEKFPLDGPIKSMQDLEDYSPPDPHKSYRWNTLKMMKAMFDGERALAVCVHDSFEYPWFLRGGMDEFLKDFYRDPELIKAITKMAVDYNIELVEEAAQVGADFVVAGDDYAYKHGPLMSPEQFEEFILPGLTRLVEATHQEGLLFLKHTDGNIWSILDMLVNAGIDGICPLEPKAGMDIGKVKQKYGRQISVVGNIDCTQLLPSGMTKEVKEAVRECIREAAPAGGHILSSSNTIHYGVKPANYLAMIEALREYGNYRLQVQ